MHRVIKVGDGEVWYRVRAKSRRRPVVYRDDRPAAPGSSGGKAREAGRGSRSQAAPDDKSNPRRREGRGEGGETVSHPTE